MNLSGFTSQEVLDHYHLELCALGGFQMSKHDKCLLYKKDIIIFLWVDDCGVCAPTMKLVDDLIERLKEKGLSLQKEGNFTDYLGINFVHDEKTKSITMTQKGLINKIIEATGLHGCPLIWRSQLQSSVALSTLQAEYNALSQAMRSVIATRRVVEELLTNLDLPFEKPTIYSEVFEDNSGAFYLATKQRLTPRTKHFNTFLHFFWEHVGDHPGGT